MIYAYIIILVFACQIVHIKCQPKLTDYKDLPPIYESDDYDACVIYNNAPNSTYCVVYAEIIPENTSTLWQQIEKISSDKRHFRHDRLFFGVCLERCKNLIESLDKPLYKTLYKGDVTDKENVEQFALVHGESRTEYIQYEKLLGICLNYDFQRKHQLSLRTHIKYCERNDKKITHDEPADLFTTVLNCIILVNIISSIIDHFLKPKDAPIDASTYYQTDFESKALQLLTAFSIRRNYNRLMEPIKTTTQKDFQFLDGYRMMTLMAIILSHTLLIFLGSPIKNIEYFELYPYTAEGATFKPGTYVVQVFFVMSALFTYLNFKERQTVTPNSSMKTCALVYWKYFIYRYLRLTPPLIMLLLYNSYSLPRAHDGPYWQHITGTESEMCSKYWWRHIFYINNLSVNRSCGLHTWYLAADMQLYALYLLIIIFILKYPKLKRATFAVVLLFSIAIPALVTYFQELDVIYMIMPENYRYLYFKDIKSFTQSAIPFYTNMGCYLFGIFCAEYYLKSTSASQKSKVYQGKFLYELGWWCSFLAFFAFIHLCNMFISYDLKHPSIATALFATFYRNIWSLLTLCCIVGMRHKLGGIAYRFCTLPIFQILARISYQTFLWHLTVILVAAGYLRESIYVNRFYFNCLFLGLFVIINLIAYFMALFVEYPVNALLKFLLLKSKGKSKNTAVTQKQKTK